MIESNPISQWTVVGVGMLGILLAFLALYFRFGLVLAYRIALTLFAGFAFLLRWVFAYSIGEMGAPVSPRLSDWFVWAPETTVKELLELVSVNTLRVVLAEMAVYSFVKSYKPAIEHFRRVMTRHQAPPQARGPLAPVNDAVNRLSEALLRAAIMMQHFAVTFWGTLVQYLWGVYRVARRIIIDFVTPLVTLAATAFILGMLSEHTGAYILGRPQGKLLYLGPIRQPWLVLPLLFLMVYAVQMVFLAAITKFPWRALLRCNFLLVLWIAPFFFAFFVFVSISLVATGAVLQRWDTAFPYKLGPFTAAAATVLVLLIVYAVLQNLRHRMAEPQDASSIPPPVEPESPAVTHVNSPGDAG